MKQTNLLLLLALMIPHTLTAKEESDEKKVPPDYIARATDFLDADRKSRSRKQAARDWLKGVKEDRPDLGDHRYYSALAHLTLAETDLAATQLLNAIEK